jgi:hypothetical protein
MSPHASCSLIVATLWSRQVTEQGCCAVSQTLDGRKPSLSLYQAEVGEQELSADTFYRRLMTLITHADPKR